MGNEYRNEKGAGEEREEARRRKDDKKISEETGKRAKERRRERGREEREEHRIIEDWTNETPPALSASNLHPRINSPAREAAAREERHKERERERERDERVSACTRERESDPPPWLASSRNEFTTGCVDVDRQP